MTFRISPRQRRPLLGLTALMLGGALASLLLDVSTGHKIASRAVITLAFSPMVLYFYLAARLAYTTIDETGIHTRTIFLQRYDCAWHEVAAIEAMDTGGNQKVRVILHNTFDFTLGAPYGFRAMPDPGFEDAYAQILTQWRHYAPDAVQEPHKAQLLSRWRRDSLS